MRWTSDPSRPFPKSRRWHKRNAAKLADKEKSSRPTTAASSVSVISKSEVENYVAPLDSPTPTTPQIPFEPALPRMDMSPKSPPTSLPAPTSPQSPAAPRPPPKSWSALVSQNAKPATTPTVPPPKLTNGKMAGLGAALTSFDPFSTASSIAPVIRPRGLINTGNLCFMNVVLQALLYCPPFYNLLDTIGRNVVHKISSQTPLLDALYIPFLRE